MCALYAEASFRNSRIMNRNPTTQSTTLEMPIPVTIGNAKIMLVPEDQNRTYVTIRNTNPRADEIYYYYDPMVEFNGGMLLRGGEAADLVSPQAIYVANHSANTVLMMVDFGEG